MLSYPFVNLIALELEEFLEEYLVSDWFRADLSMEDVIQSSQSMSSMMCPISNRRGGKPAAVIIPFKEGDTFEKANEGKNLARP